MENRTSRTLPRVSRSWHLKQIAIKSKKYKSKYWKARRYDGLLCEVLAANGPLSARGLSADLHHRGIRFTSTQVEMRLADLEGLGYVSLTSRMSKKVHGVQQLPIWMLA
jgi:hypothetical protein